MVGFGLSGRGSVLAHDLQKGGRWLTGKGGRGRQWYSAANAIGCGGTPDWPGWVVGGGCPDGGGNGIRQRIPLVVAREGGRERSEPALASRPPVAYLPRMSQHTSLPRQGNTDQCPQRSGQKRPARLRSSETPAPDTVSAGRNHQGMLAPAAELPSSPI